MPKVKTRLKYVHLVLTREKFDCFKCNTILYVWIPGHMTACIHYCCLQVCRASLPGKSAGQVWICLIYLKLASCLTSQVLNFKSSLIVSEHDWSCLIKFLIMSDQVSDYVWSCLTKFLIMSDHVWSSFSCQVWLKASHVSVLAGRNNILWTIWLQFDTKLSKFLDSLFPKHPPAAHHSPPRPLVVWCFFSRFKTTFVTFLTFLG
jgi:hypothetical protein